MDREDLVEGFVYSVLLIPELYYKDNLKLIKVADTSDTALFENNYGFTINVPFSDIRPKMTN